MSDPFETAIDVVLEHEGGYSNDPHDPGGETNWGISKRAYPNVDIKNLSRAEAIAIYRRDYWEAAGCHQLPAALALALFDTAVNQGVATGVRMLQATLGVPVDGVVGTRTIGAARACDRETVLAEWLAERAVRYAALPTFGRYGRGWMRRVFDLFRVCLTLT